MYCDVKNSNNDLGIVLFIIYFIDASKHWTAADVRAVNSVLLFDAMTLPLQGTQINNRINLISPETGVSGLVGYILPLTVYV